MCKIWRTVISLSRRQISLLPSVIGIILILYSYMTADISKKTILVRTQPMFSGKTTQKYKEPSPASMTNLNVSLIEQRFSERRNLLLRQCKERLKWNDHILEYSSLEITKMIVDILRSSRQLFKEAMNSEQFLRFFVAREPLARLLSGYLNRIKYTDDRSYQRQHWGPLILGYTRGLRQRDVAYPNKTLYIIPTFEEFARYLVSQNPRNFDPHWLPIGFQCGVCEYNYTHIVHLETFVEDMEYIISVTGIDKGVDMAKISLRQNVGIGNTRKVLKKYYSTLDAKTLQKIVDIYKDDFKLFGYDPSQMLKEISPNVTIKF
ncbi:carbohydrate sulfotransferase 14-like isoform X2 [Palaemon carinicauda]|uniref:carbohydrate sulfotransferase 14-like isoform X2 n=1 Tax=Palaemon carinicauda TaxID=392227 RepID=UPI0035B63BB1